MATVQEALLIAFDYYEAGRRDAAETVLDRILEVEPADPAANYLYGVVLVQSGRAAAAEPRLAAAAAARDVADYHSAYGMTLSLLGKVDMGIAAFRRAVALAPGHVGAGRGLAELLTDRGRRLCLATHDEAAVADLREALRNAPDNAQAALWLATALAALERTEEALAGFRFAAALDPAQPAVWRQLAARSGGQVAARLVRRAISARMPTADVGDWWALAAHLEEPAASVARRLSLALDPADYTLWNDHGAALVDFRPEEAERSCRRALSLHGDCLPAMIGLASALINQGRPAEASAFSAQALRLAPRCVEAVVVHADALRDQGRWEAAESICRQAGEDAPAARLLTGLLRLGAGDLEQGWNCFRDRWSNPAAARLKPRPAVPEWRGEPLNGPLLVWAEQGLGDEIMFASLLPDLSARGVAVIWEADARLHPLLRRAAPHVRLVGRCGPSAVEGVAIEEGVAAHIAMGDLPSLLRRRTADFPVSPPASLIADSAAVAAARRRWDRGDGALLVGISWRSSNRRYGGCRSLDPARPAAALVAAAKRAGRPIRLINLQYGDVAVDIRAARAAGFDIECDPKVDPLTDIDGLAALICALDLTVSIDNTTVHLAGALGAPVWALLPYVADWRWMRDRADSLWSPAISLFRQPAPGDWDAALSALSATLSRCCDGEGAFFAATRSEH